MTMLPSVFTSAPWDMSYLFASCRLQLYSSVAPWPPVPWGACGGNARPGNRMKQWWTGIGKAGVMRDGKEEKSGQSCTEEAEAMWGMASEMSHGREKYMTHGIWTRQSLGTLSSSQGSTGTLSCLWRELVHMLSGLAALQWGSLRAETSAPVLWDCEIGPLGKLCRHTQNWFWSEKLGKIPFYLSTEEFFSVEMTVLEIDNVLTLIFKPAEFKHANAVYLSLQKNKDKWENFVNGFSLWKWWSILEFLYFLILKQWVQHEDGKQKSWICSIFQSNKKICALSWLLYTDFSCSQACHF